MRTRVIRPAAFSDEAVGQITGEQLKCLLGLLCMADSQGRLEDKPAQIQARIFPYSKPNMGKMLGALEEQGLICRYTVGEGHYIVIPGMRDKNSPLVQNWHVNEPSALPAPGALPAKKAPETAKDPPPTKAKAKGKGKEPEPKPDLYTERFLALWAVARKQESRQKAAEAFAKLNADQALYTTIYHAWAADNERWAEEGRELKLCPALGPWLNQERWKDREPVNGVVSLTPEPEPLPPEPELTPEEIAIARAQLADSD